ncbi:helix-turn-helix domain-containing protein [Caloranaerobacter azorensis]|uniref:Helix-turn-helix domain-containing protein n=1 Tax=Caloranaerobacter azorensis TaxID=116090 RepID=A0A6P1YCP1_9FIRM|nr:helix-turn-helix domain-containing protein [Caloranaerobacter azorensis]QIB27099.1 helix-turn-helix domain-containing protein [Caloranaerobacter azorensis]
MTKKRWTKEEVDYLVENYSKKSINSISKDLGRTKDSVFKKAKRLGLTKTVRNWTEEEIDILTLNWGKRSVEKIARMLNRSTISVKKKAMELKLGSQYIANGEYLSTGNIGFLLNKNPTTVYKWLKEGIIKGRTFGKKSVYRVTPEDFIDFLKNNPNKWCGYSARIDLIKPYFYTSKQSSLPEWFIKKVNSDFKKSYGDIVPFL